MTIRLDLKIVPGASREGVAGWLGDALKIRVRAPAERGKANRAVTSVLASALAIDPDAIEIVSGHTHARKTVTIAGLTLDEVRARLARFE